MPAFPKSFLSISDEIERIRLHYGSDLEKPCLIVGNGPSSAAPSLSKDEINQHFKIRMNWFFLEEKKTYGASVDAFFWSVDNRGLREALALNSKAALYSIKGVFQPHLSTDDVALRARETEEPPYPDFDHWAVISTCPELARSMMSRPLPTQGMQAMAFAAILGFKTIRLTGVDMYGSPDRRYAWNVPESARRYLREKDLKPGYEPHHDMDRDLRFLEMLRSKFDFELLPASKMDVLEECGVFDRSFSIAGKQINSSVKAPAKAAQENGRYAYVTHADGRYSLGAIALARSLQKHSDHKLIVMHSDEAAPHFMQHLPNVELRYVDKIQNPSENGQARFATTYTKLRVFEVKGYDRLTFIDSDAVVLKGVDDLFEAEGFCAAPDLGLGPVAAKRTFNSGVFSFDCRSVDFGDILIASLSYHSDDGGDQGFLNTYFDGQVNYLPVAYNTLKRALVYHPELISMNDVKVLHYVGAIKPWDLIGDFDREYLHMNLEWAKQMTAEDWNLLYFATINFARRRVDKKAFQDMQKNYALEALETKSRLEEVFPGNRQSFGSWLENAREMVSKGNLSLAIYLYTRALRENPQSSNAMLELATTYLGIGDRESAAIILERASGLRPDRTDIASLLAEITSGDDRAVQNDARETTFVGRPK